MTAPRLRIGVVGAGVVGCSAAFELARRGADVTVFDMRSPGGGATQASAGILAPFIEGHEHGPLLDLAVRGLDVYDVFVTRLRAADGATPFEYQRKGTLEVADTPHRVEILKRRAAALPADVGSEWLDAAQMHALEPATNSDYEGALLCRIHGFIAVMPFVDALVGAARMRGARIHAGVPVREIICAGAACALRTDDDVHQFDRILLSAGSWASGLDPLDEIGGMVKPVKGQLVTLRWTGPRIERVLWGPACYIVPWEDSTLLVGATSEDVGFDERPTAEGVHDLLSAALDLLPGAAAASFEGVRVGLRPATADGMPMIRPSQADPRVFYATGHFRNGVLLAPLTANLVADYFLSGQQHPAFSTSDGACPRFAAKPPKSGTGPV